MKINGNEHQTIWFDKEKKVVKIIDQTKLPHQFIIKDLKTISKFLLSSSLNAFEAVVVIFIGINDFKTPPLSITNPNIVKGINNQRKYLFSVTYFDAQI